MYHAGVPIRWLFRHAGSVRYPPREFGTESAAMEIDIATPVRCQKVAR